MDTFAPALQSLLARANARLVACERPVNLVHLAPGADVAWDNCCGDNDSGGQLWVRVLSVTPQPQPSAPCGMTHLSARFGLGVVRCMHGLQDEGFPTAEQMTDDTLAMTDDASLLLWALREWETEVPRFVIPRSLVVESGTPLGPSGFCGGWEWTLALKLQICDGC